MNNNYKSVAKINLKRNLPITFFFQSGWLVNSIVFLFLVNFIFYFWEKKKT